MCIRDSRIGQQFQLFDNTFRQLPQGGFIGHQVALHQPKTPLGKYGRMRLNFLKQQHPVMYHTMLLNGSLYPHLMEVEQTAESQMQQTLSLIHILWYF